MMGLGAISGIVTSTLGFFFDSSEVKAVKESGKVELAKLELEMKKERLLTSAKAESSYDQQAMHNMKSSWKDEYLIILHTFPIWGYGIPSESLHLGLDRIWIQFNGADHFWWITYIGIIASTFGLRWLFAGRVDTMIREVK